MNILVDTTTVNQRQTGTGIYTCGLLNTLSKLQQVTGITALGGDASVISRLASEKIRHISLAHNSWHRLVQLDLPGNRRNLMADASFFPNFFSPANVPFPVYTTVHDLSFFSHPEYYRWKMVAWYRHFVKKSVERSEGILTVSNTSANAIHDYLKVSYDRIHVIRPGFSLPETEPDKTKRQRNSPYFIYAGNIEPKKNIIAMLEGFVASGIKKKLIVAGNITSKRLKTGFLRLVNRHPDIEYIGYPVDRELALWLQNADGHVNLSHVEGCGLTLLEAFRFGIPSLISMDPAMAEIAGDQAVKVQTNRIPQIAEGFRLLNEFQVDENFRRHCDKIKHEYRWERFAEGIQQLLTKEHEYPEKIYHSLRRNNLTPVKKSIVMTLGYHAVFGTPVSKSMLYFLLFRCKCTLKEFEESWSELKEQYPHLFFEKQGYCGLSEYCRNPGEVKRNKTENTRFIRQNKGLLKKIAGFPFCRGVFLSGGSVHGTHVEGQDIDLFIVSAGERVWILYTLLRFFAAPTGGKTILCTNYLVDRSALTIHWQRDLYTAHQMLHLHPAVPDSEKVNPVYHNRWVHDIFPNYLMTTCPVNGTGNPKKQGLTSWLNLLLMVIWTGRWRRQGKQNRRGGVLWDAHRIKLHINDHRPRVYKKWAEILEETESRIESAVYEYTE